MSRISTHTITAGLIGTGVCAWAFAGRPLVANPDLAVPLNPLGINGSPYGEVFAMAMQGPIDTYFDVGMSGGGHVHKEGVKCEIHEQDSVSKSAANQATVSLEKRFGNFLDSLSEAAKIRTNPYGTSDALKRHLRRQAEDKLRFAYKLDPSHYGNYNSLHFFLTEPAVGTRPELTPTAAKLADDTIQYCLKKEGDPRPALTAAAAATNILQLLFDDQKNEKPKFNTTQMRHYLEVLDFCLARYDAIAREWDLSKNWALLSPQRINECQERYDFIGKIRNASEKTILRFEGKHQPQVSN